MEALVAGYGIFIVVFIAYGIYILFWPVVIHSYMKKILAELKK